MKQYNLSNLVAQAESALVSYLMSSLPVGNHRNQAKLGEHFLTLWNEQTFKGPYIESLPQYVRESSLADLANSTRFATPRLRSFCERTRPIHDWKNLERTLNLKRFLRARRQLWPDGGANSIEEMENNVLQKLWQRPLYAHQSQAFELVATRKENLIVATGTGSGKTECFLLPLLCELLTEPDEVRRKSGVRAILLYPMNALVEDQMARLRRLLFWLNLRAFDAPSEQTRLSRPITFGRYTGETKVNENDKGPDRSVSEEEVHESGELRYREEMQLNPPDILVTNFTMLEYILLRNDDRRLFREPSLFKFLILDEVHTYRGTTGMEVATLLCRFRDHLARSFGGKSPSYCCIGTSATLGTEADARAKMAKFATRLFGSPFSGPQVITGTVVASDSIPLVRQFDPEATLKGFSNLPVTSPSLCAVFAIDESGNGPDNDTEISSDEWTNLADALSSIPTVVDELISKNIERTEILGRLILSSSCFQRLRNSLVAGREGVASLAIIARNFFGAELFEKRSGECCQAIGRLVQLVQAGRSDGEGLLPLRTHLFVREHRHAYLCIDRAHLSSEVTETDGWWSKLFVNHRNICDSCSSIVYPLLLCRKCGFVVLEGWYRPKLGRILPEKDDLLGPGQFRRTLFRPLNALSERMRDRLLVEPGIATISLCTHCGLRFPHGAQNHLDAALGGHSKVCSAPSVIEAVEWAQKDIDVTLDECPYCDQEWFAGQEVITPPTLSLYAAATILLEEMKRGLDAPLEGTGAVNKVLCFSDSRQQAAFLASRLQRTNEDFTFRQVVYGVLSESENPILTRSLITRVTEYIAADSSLAQLFCEPDELSDESLMRRRVATLLFRDVATEYRTLESLGVVSILYPDNLLACASDVLRSENLSREFSDAERRSYIEFILDWTFRFHRWAVAAGSIPVLFGDLEKYGYRDRSIGKRGGDQYSQTSGFSLKQENSRSRIFDFYRRLCKREARPMFTAGLPHYQSFMEKLWDTVLSNPEYYSRPKLGVPPPEDRLFMALAGTDSDTLQLKMNWLSLRWKRETESFELFRCDSCGYITRSSVKGLCPVRDCSGTLRTTTIGKLSTEKFSPARHYLTLLRTKSPKPLWVEEHTAQISPVARRQIEESFRSEERGSIDIISGSTTFELGIDLGIVNGVFLANMPPEVSNYRQRAGRAGRRTGVMPIVFTYVRERPHDSYFWNKPEYFIAGPLRVPRFSAPSFEVLLRHINATLYSFLIQGYPTPTGLQGPPVGEFIKFAFDTSREASLRQQARTPTSELAKTLKAVLNTNASLPISPEESLDRFYKRLKHFQDTYLSLVNDDGTIPTFSDYGILPSYNYPIYVDELRLYECPRTEKPRKDLKLQRDRSISLNEYFPGRIIVAGKVAIRSVGLWKGFKFLPFQYCRDCAFLDTREVKSSATCPNGCGPLVSLSAVRPLGGFLGKVETGLARQDPELFAVARSQFLFDPAGNPPPELTYIGAAVGAARQTSFHVEKSGARMRTFVPRPDGEQSLELGRANLRDVGMQGTQNSECLVLPAMAHGAKDKLFLMHEFTTDILRVQMRENHVGRMLLSSPPYRKAADSGDEGERKKARAIVLWTLSQALAIGGARLLQIDPREIAFTFRHAPTDALLKNEVILFDTASGGAGYCNQLYDDMRELFTTAADVLDCKENCGDSCYACLRSFDNQAIHFRLNRFFVLEGLRSFVNANWA